MRWEDQKSPRGKHKKKQKGRRKVVRRVGKTEEATLPDARSPLMVTTELDLVAPVLLVGGSTHVNQWRLDVWLLLGQGDPR
jgi:hypothetical protein